MNISLKFVCSIVNLFVRFSSADMLRMFGCLFLLSTLSTAALSEDTASWAGMTLDGAVCVGKGQGFGPYDYFDVDEESDRLYHEGRLWEASWRHFDEGMRILNGGGLVLADYLRATDEFDYMLRAYPNHPGSLAAIIELEMKKNIGSSTSKTTLRSSMPPPECYFQRAVSFRPMQPHIRILFGIYLHRISKLEGAVAQYLSAIEIDPSSAEAHYNVGLAYVDLGMLGLAEAHSDKAYELGHPLPGLRRKLSAARQKKL